MTIRPAMRFGLAPIFLRLRQLASGLFVFPALTIAQHRLLPRRRSVEELYG